MKKNLLINYSTGDKCLDSIDGDIFLKSLSKFKTFDKVVFYNSVSEYNLNKLSQYFDELVYTEENLYTGYMAFYKWLVNKQNEYEYVMNTDLRDVILQSDPFEFMKNKPEYDLFLVAEGMKINENECNLIWEKYFKNLLRSHNNSYNENLILSGGIFAGKIQSFISHCLMLFSNTNRKSDFLVLDQQVMGYLSQFYKLNPKVYICDPHVDNFCATGEAIKRNNISPIFKNNLVYSKMEEPYCIFHQWDRTEVADSIRLKHESALSFII